MDIQGGGWRLPVETGAERLRMSMRQRIIGRYCLAGRPGRARLSPIAAMKMKLGENSLDRRSGVDEGNRRRLHPI